MALMGCLRVFPTGSFLGVWAAEGKPPMLIC